MTDLLIRNGLLVDGTGTAARRGDLAVAGDTITAVGELPGALTAPMVIDADGAVVAPGFIDIHGHSDFSILGNPAGTSKVLQGVTTEVVGNCGLSVVPITDAAVAAQLRPLMTYCDDPSVDWDWTSVASYLDRVRTTDPLLDVLVLAGHNAIRASVVGLDQRPATRVELDRMRRLLHTALDDGAVGMSIGLMYPPSCYADEDELVALGTVLAEHDRMMASHMADYGAGVVESVAAMIRVAERSGCRMQISHLTTAGHANWGRVRDALALVDAAAARGVDVAVDMYPYLAGSTNLSQLVPLWTLDGGLERFRERLDDPATHAAVVEHLGDRALGWDEILLAAVSSDPALNGKRVAELAAERDTDPAVVVIDLLRSCDPTIVAFGRSEDDLRAVLSHPRATIGSDGLAIDTCGTVGGPVPHPRFFGAFPALFQRYVRDEPLLSLEAAVHKCTGASAQRLRLSDRGILAAGRRADIVIFDRATIADRSTYTDSRQVPAGIDVVFRSGVAIARAGVIVATPGTWRTTAA